MALLPSQRLGPYEILSAIGAGGMGEVYRAKDTRLDRIIAIKVLPSHLAERAELRERFEREARTIASLNHPHICTLFDIGHQDGIDFLAMEYLEGETLAERLKKGPLPIEQVLQYAIEIADALDKAHRKGITHRDLKPGNIMLTKSGSKLLDFGLAKLRGPQAAVANLSALPTEGSNLTAQGTILGTLQYMAPEQLEGKEADARTDIFAFGVVVYEMATGKKAFDGKSQASLIAKILETDPPPISSLQPMTPPAVDRVVKKCLAKDREDRWQSAKDLTDELKWIAGGGAESSKVAAPKTKPTRKAWERRMVLISAAVAIAALGGAATRYLKPSPASPTLPITRTVITLPPGQQFADLDRSRAVALSPDGTYLAYVAREGGVQHLYLRPMDGLESKLLPGTEGAANPFFSPDSQWLAFFADGKLKKVSVSGGAAVILGDGALPGGGSWSSQGTIAFVPTSVSPIEVVSDAGGDTQMLTHLEKGEFSHHWPEFLPDGKALLFTVRGTADRLRIAARSATGERKILALGGATARYAPSGHLIYAQNGSLMAAPFDPQRLTVTGTAVPVVDSILQVGVTVQYTLSAIGSLAYVPGDAQAGQRKSLVWVDRKGAETPLAATVNNYLSPRLSPDGRRIVVSTGLPGTLIFLYDISRDALSTFTFRATLNQLPIWTPDGKRIAFDSNLEGSAVNIYWQLADGGGLERLTTDEFSNWPTSWSPDGQLLTYVQGNPTTAWDIWVLRMSDRKAEPFVRTPANEGGPHFSPDGHFIAYVSDESGRWEVYVQPYPGPGGKWQISTDGGTEPMWNPNGRELFYRNGDKMMAVDITTQPGFSTGKPHTLFEGPYQLSLSPIAAYDVSANGQRFLMIKPNEQTSSSAPTQIVVVQNWFEELKQKVPAGKK
jgi:serine/threonine protein kinase